MRYLLIFLIVIEAFAIKDFLPKPTQNSLNSDERILFRSVPNYPESLFSNTESDEYNIFKYSGHFRVVFGKSYQNNEEVNLLADSILEIANNVWEKEVEEIGFKAPINSSNFYIDIYIGNKNSYNKAKGFYETIADYYAGYASNYDDGTPYFIVNPDIDSNVLKVTIAHEFFHTIQYAYGLNKVNDEIWDKNIWFLEASAVMMEDLVYDSINDYKIYVSDYLPYTNLYLEYSNGAIEYGKVLFVKYLVKQYGIEFIKKLFEGYNINETILTDLKLDLKNEENKSFSDFMLDYGNCLINLSDCFPNETIRNSLRRYSLDSNMSVGNYGIVFFSSGDDYLIGSTSFYSQSDFEGNKNKKENVSNNGLIFINDSNESLQTDLLQFNKFKNIEIKTGWNLISNISDKNISFDEFGGDIIWVYRNNRYYAFSSNLETQKLIEEKGYSTDENILLPNEGAWIYSKEDYSLNLNFDSLIDSNNLSLQNGWNLVAFSNNVYNLNELTDDLLIWHYEDGKWKYFSKKIDNLDNMERLDKILPQKGYFILKQ